MQKGDSNVWNLSLSLPEDTPIGNYGLELNLMMIDGTRKTISMNNIIEIIGVDSDRDGVVDAEDAFPEDPDENSDRDGDGVGDNSDVFPDDSSETWMAMVTALETTAMRSQLIQLNGRIQIQMV